jgi:serine/threonine-protein kinase
MPDMVTSDLGACEWFVWDLRRSGLIDRGQLDTIVGEFLKRNPRAEAPALAEFLVSQGTLTAFQAERVLNGKTQGLVLGPYVLLDAIGSGSMGQVYKASSKNDGNLYAVKVLPRRSMWNVRLARRQVRSFSTFSHAAVVPFVDVGTAGGLHYLVWPLVEGTTLEGLVQQMGKLPSNLAAMYGVQIAQGLTESHQNNLFHGLIKPSNIMVGGDNQGRILDFGIGSLLVENEGESLVDTMSTANTLTSGLDCTSPESIMEPTNRTPAGDQYSLGCTLYFCLTGRVPFPEGSAVEKMMAHQTKEPMPIRELSPEVPEALVAVVKKLMSKTPEGRYQGCDEVVEALEPFMGDLSAMPGGVPDSIRGAEIHKHSSGKMPGLGSRGGTGSGPKMPALPSKPAVAAPAPNFGSRPATPALAGERPLPGRAPSPTPVPQRGASMPSRATLSLPPTDGEKGSSSGRGAPPLPARGGAQQAPKVPGRSSSVAALPKTNSPAAQTRTKAKPKPAPEPELEEGMVWAEEEPVRTGRSFSALGLVLVALILMVIVYFGATILMKD